MKEKKRSPFHLHKMSDNVKKELSKKSITSGLAQWLIIERVLEGALGDKKFDAQKWLKEL